MFRCTAALLSPRILIDSCPASCPCSTSFFFVTLSSFVAPQCFNQFLTSDLCVCFFTLSLSSLALCLLFLSRSILLHSSSISGHGGRPCSSCCWHLSIWKHRGSARSIHFVFLSLHPLCTVLAQFNSNCARKQMVVLVSVFWQSYASAFSAARCRRTSAAGVLQVINTRFLKHLHHMWEILSVLVV